MPHKAPHGCNKPGCPALTLDRYCPAHARQATLTWRATMEEKRGNFRERGYTTRWDKLRKHWLIRHPLCVMCAAINKSVAAQVVDHIIPHRGDQVLMWDEANFQSLCSSHHNEKTAREVAERKRERKL